MPIEDSKSISLEEKIGWAQHPQKTHLFLKEITKIAKNHSVKDLVKSASQLPSHLRPLLFDHLPSKKDKLAFLLLSEKELRIPIFRYMKDQELLSYFKAMKRKEALEMMLDLSDRRYNRLFPLLEAKRIDGKRSCSEKGNKSCALCLMRKDFLAFSEKSTIEEVKKGIEKRPQKEVSKGVYVVDEEKKLIGFVPLRSLLISSNTSSLSSLMFKTTYQVTAQHSLMEIEQIVHKHKISNIPVVDEKNQMIGIISHDSIHEALEELAESRLEKMAGTQEERCYEKNSLLTRFSTRSPWLLFTLIVGLANVCLMSFFEKKSSSFLTFALFFVPLITGMSGNIGIQSSTVIVRHLAVGHISDKNRFSMVIKELTAGILTGAFFGILCGLFVYLVQWFFPKSFSVSPIAIFTIISSGLIGACLSGSLLGVFSPLFFEKVKVDPAISSGPVVTALNDTISMLIYFLITLGLGTYFFQ